MPILACFAVGLLFKNVDFRAAIAAVIFGVLIYACFIWIWMPLHYIHMNFFTFLFCVALALAINRLVLGKKEEFIGLRAV
jgi:SSS family solute:Na+ symporter